MSNNIVQYGPGLHVGDYVLAQTVDRDRVIDPKPKIIEGHRLEKIRVAGKDIVTGEGLESCACDNRLDVSWLPFCAEKYQISADIKDYVIVELYSVTASVPNRNLDSFPYDELTSWRSLHGMPASKTFTGKPCHQDHDNQDDTKAKGVIFDAAMARFRDRFHVKILKGFDRTKDPRLARLVQEKNRIGHSMGALVEKTECSLPTCRFLSDGVTTCDHIQQGAGKGRIANIRGEKFLIYELLRDFAYVEDSTVEDPANVFALTDYIWGVNA